MKFRFLAGVLAAGGIGWGFWSVVAIVTFHTLASLIFIPGCIITVGYIVRCFRTPQLSWRRVIWGASALVQGAWLVTFIVALISQGHISADDVFSPIVAWVWWIFALGVSIYGLCYDKRQAA